jgi:hypothetical protein
MGVSPSELSFGQDEQKRNAGRRFWPRFDVVAADGTLRINLRGNAFLGNRPVT